MGSYDFGGWNSTKNLAQMITSVFDTSVNLP